MGRIYGYARVSTAQQAVDGDSLEVQRRQIEGYALQHGWDLAEVFVEEGVSGSVPLVERAQGRALQARIRPGDIIIAAKLDRLFRSALDALQTVERLKGRGIGLHLLDLGGDVHSNGLAKVFLTMAAAFAELERDRIAERVRDAKAEQKARGRYLGGTPPFGYVVGETGVLAPKEAEQAAINKMKRMRKRGKSLRAIAAQITRDGHKVSHVAVKRLLDEG